MGGFLIAMAKNNSAFKKQIASLRAALWTDDGTRAVFLDFAAYNPARDVFVSVRMLFEFLQYGGVSPQISIRAFRDNLNHPMSSTVTENLVIEIGLYMSGIFNFFRELGKLQAVGFKQYCRGIWNIVTLVTLFLLLGSVVFRFLVSRQWRQLENSNPTISQWRIDPVSGSWDVFWDWDFLGYCNEQIVKLQAIALVCAWIRWFGFLKFFNHRIDNFVATVATAEREILTSCFILVTLVVSFAISFHSGYGEESLLFATFDTSILTLYQILLSNFNAGQITTSSGLLANILIILFTSVLTFYSVNVVLSLLWWSSVRVMSGELERESDNPEENLKYSMIAVLTSLIEKYAWMGRICSPLLRWIRRTPPHEASDDLEKGDSAISTVTALMKQLVNVTRSVEHSVFCLEESFAVQLTHEDENHLLAEVQQFSVTSIRNRYQRILFANLLKAIRSQDADMVSDMLLQYNLDQAAVDLEWRDSTGNSALHIASSHSDCEIVQLLLEAGANPNAPNRDLNTSLHIAALYGNCDSCEALIYDGNAAVEATNAHKFTPLHIAAYLGYFEIVELLAEQNEQMILEMNIDGLTPLHLAVAFNQLEVSDYIIRRWPSALCASESCPLLHFAIQARSKLEVVRQLLKFGCKVTAEDKYGKNATSIAEEIGAELSIIRILNRVLAMGDNYENAINSLEPGSATVALIEAAKAGDLNEISLLLAEGADFNGAGSFNTPLHAAVTGKHHEILAILLDSSADVNLRNVKGLTPIQLAVQLGFFCEFCELVEAYDNFPLDADGNTLLHLAVDGHCSPNLDIVKNLVLEQEISPLTENQFGQSALDTARNVLSLMSALSGTAKCAPKVDDQGATNTKFEESEYDVRSSIVQFLEEGLDVIK